MPTRDQLQPRHPAADWLTRDVLEELGGAPAVAEALELATYTEPRDQLPSKERQLLEMLGDPVFSSMTLPTLMKKVGLLLPDLLDAFRRRDVALSIARSGRQMDGVLRGVEQMAQSRWVLCKRCNGDGEILDEALMRSGTLGSDEPIPMRPCPAECENGKTLKDPNLDAVRIYLDVHGVGKKAGSGTTINLSAQAQAGARAEAGGKERGVPAQENVTDRVQAMLEGGNV